MEKLWTVSLLQIPRLFAIPGTIFVLMETLFWHHICSYSYFHQVISASDTLLEHTDKTRVQLLSLLPPKSSNESNRFISVALSYILVFL